MEKVTTAKKGIQDTFILLGTGAYSDVDSEVIGLSRDQWNSYSRIIRLEHECTHYVIQRIFGRSKQNLMDEFIADFLGIVTAFKEFRSDLMLRFMGLENFPDSSPESRIEYYRGNPPLSQGEFSIQKQLYLAATDHLADVFRQNQGFGVQFDRCKDNLLILLTSKTMEELASAGIKRQLQEVACYSLSRGI